jgi:CheY-like chemotaxis protein
LLCHFSTLSGSGLGLWIAKGITSIHGGAIGVECEEVGKGSMFYVELPLIEGSDFSICSNGTDNHLDPKSETKRVWRWRDQRNNIDPNNVITPTSRNQLIVRRDSRFFPANSKQVIPSRNGQPPISENEDPTQFRPPIPTELPPTRSTLRILVVDDVKSIRKLFARVLSNQGHSCDTACDGQECVDLFTKQQSQDLPSSAPLGSAPVPVAVCPYDLVLMDSEMPVMNGPTATKIIRSLGFKELVILGVTGNVLPEDVEMFLAHGVDAVLGKPLTVERMWEEYDRIAK